MSRSLVPTREPHEVNGLPTMSPRMRDTASQAANQRPIHDPAPINTTDAFTQQQLTTCLLSGVHLLPGPHRGNHQELGGLR